jgi:hypothetical protein
MKTFSSTIKSVLSFDNIEGFYLLRITDVDGSVIFSSTTHYTDITLSNNNTYFSDGLILSIDPPQLSSTVDREQYKIVLIDPTFSQSSKLDTTLLGKVLETRIGFVNNNNIAASETPLGQPFTNVNDTFVLYKGRVDSVAYEIDANELGEVKLAITGSSPLINLDQKNGIYISRESIRAANSSDTSCDETYQGSGVITLKWGKK